MQTGRITHTMTHTNTSRTLHACLFLCLFFPNVNVDLPRDAPRVEVHLFTSVDAQTLVGVWVISHHYRDPIYIPLPNPCPHPYLFLSCPRSTEGTTFLGVGKSLLSTHRLANSWACSAVGNSCTHTWHTESTIIQRLVHK